MLFYESSQVINEGNKRCDLSKNYFRPQANFTLGSKEHKQLLILMFTKKLPNGTFT